MQLVVKGVPSRRLVQEQYFGPSHCMVFLMLHETWDMNMEPMSTMTLTIYELVLLHEFRLDCTLIVTVETL